MMSQEVADALADALRQQYEFINKCYNEDDRQKYFIQLRDDTIAIANVVVASSTFTPDMDEWYERAGYLGVAPRYISSRPR